MRREAEQARIEAERKKKEEQEQQQKQQANEQQAADGVIDVSMTSASTEVATPNPHREIDLGF